MQFALPPLTPVTKKLMIINGGLFVLCWILSLVSPWAKSELYWWLSLNPSLWGAEPPFLPIWQLVTHGFLHSTMQPTHVLWNMVQLYFFGTMLEAAIGGRRFLVTYMAAMVCGALLQLFVMTVSSNSIPAVGASGAVTGIVVAMAALRPRAQIFVFFIPVTLWLLAAVIVGLDLINGINSLRYGAETGIAHWVHLGGALWGYLSVKFGWIQVDWIERYRAHKAVAGEQTRLEEDLKMDVLLKKIHREGMSSLTRAERHFLKRVSSRK